MELTRIVDNELYLKKSLAAARDAYRDYCQVRATPKGYGLAEITVSVKKQYESEARQILLEFWNYFLDSACQHHLEEE